MPRETKADLYVKIKDLERQLTEMKPSESSTGASCSPQMLARLELVYKKHPAAAQVIAKAISG